jgi:hypothetical protein
VLRGYGVVGRCGRFGFHGQRIRVAGEAEIAVSLGARLGEAEGADAGRVLRDPVRFVVAKGAAIILLAPDSALLALEAARRRRRVTLCSDMPTLAAALRTMPVSASASRNST